MRKKNRMLLLLLALGILALQGGCFLLGAKPSSDLVYTLPTRITLGIGESLPGTTIKYVRMGEDGAHILIDDQEALKRKGDSLDWRGEPRPGVQVDLRLRVVWITEEDVELLGTAKVTIEDPQPRRATISTSSEMTYGGPVAYSVKKGEVIPGTALTYEGETDEGARLGNTDAYPYRKAGDSIYWEGTLRDGVYLKLDVRAIQYSESTLRVGGWATLWIGP